MIIVKISGGLGNQMYQYALYRKYQKLGINAKISLSFFRDNEIVQNVPGHSAKYLLGDVFTGLHEDFCTEEEEKHYVRLSTNKISRQLAIRGLLPNVVIEDSKNEKTTFHPEVFKRRRGFIDGYWQSVKYFEDILPQLKEEFIFGNPLNGDNELIADQMQKTNSVSIHVRRGDYLMLGTEYEILDTPYYYRAIEEINKAISNPRYFIFSDDIEWCKKHLGVDGDYITWNRGPSSYIDMQLMSMCKANIVANSTFSIWAALLNKEKNPIIIRPYKYSGSPEQKADRWPESWKEIKY